MNALFGDATTTMTTPASRAESAPFSGNGSPVPSLHLGQHEADAAIPGLDIDPPDVEIRDGKAILSTSRRSSVTSEGLGGWISNMVQRTRGNGEGDASSAKYKRVDTDED